MLKFLPGHVFRIFESPEMSNGVREKTFSSPVNINNVRAEATSTRDPHHSFSARGVCERECVHSNAGGEGSPHPTTTQQVPQ